jgi:hypothetical protein
VCFHALKSQIIALLLSQEPIPQTVAKLQRLFAANPVSIRPERRTPRRKQSAWRSYHYQRNTKKDIRGFSWLKSEGGEEQKRFESETKEGRR